MLKHYVCTSLKTKRGYTQTLINQKSPKDAAAEFLSKVYQQEFGYGYDGANRHLKSTWMKSGVLHAMHDIRLLRTLPDATDGSALFNGGRGTCLDTCTVTEVELNEHLQPIRQGKTFGYWGSTILSGGIYGRRL